MGHIRWPLVIGLVIIIIRMILSAHVQEHLWIECCSMSFNSLGCAAGVVIASALFNPRDTNCLRAALTVCLVDFFVSSYAGFAVFSVLGYLAFLKGTTLEEFESTGFDVAFITLPETVANLPLPQFWAIIIFLTLLLFGFDSTVPALELIVTDLGDQFPVLMKRRWLHVAIVIVPTFLVALVYTCQGGMYLLTLIDWFTWGPALPLFALIEAVVLGWIYGIPPLSASTEEMYGRNIPNIMRILIKVVAPVLFLVIFVYSIYAYRPLQYGEYIYPGWANAIGWMLVAVIIVPMPTWMCYTLWTCKGMTIKKVMKLAFNPEAPICREKRQDTSDLSYNVSEIL